MTQATDQEQDRASQGVYTEMRNTSERLNWYQDLALGMYLYWTVDCAFRYGQRAFGDRGISGLSAALFHSASVVLQSA